MTALERFLIGLAIYCGALSYSILLLGRTGNISHSSLLAVLIFSLVVASPFAINWLRQIKKIPRLPRLSLFSWLLTAVLAVHIVIYLIGALAPEVKFDALWYHLTEAKTYLAEGRVRTFYPPAQLSQSSVTPRLQDMLYVYTLSFSSNEIVSKLLHFGFGMLTLLAVYALGRRLKDATTGLLAATIFASLPIFGWLAQTAYVDLSASFYGSLTALLLLAESPWLGVVLGLFLSTKIWALIIVPVVFGYRLLTRRSLDWALPPVALALAIASPWFFEAYFTTGNPVFPIFSLNQPELLGGYQTASQWLLHGWPHQFWPNMQKLFIHEFPVLALIPGLMVLGLRSRTNQILFIVSIVTYALFSVIANPDPRFLLPFLAIPAVLLAKMFLEQNLFIRAVVGAGLIAIIFSTFVPQYFRTEPAFDVVLAKTSRQSYLEAALGKDIHTFIDVGGEVKSRLNPYDRVVVLVHNMFYIDVPYHDAFDLKRVLSQTHSPQELLATLRQQGYTHILVKTREYKLKDLFAMGSFRQLSQDEYEKLVPIVWSSDVTNTALYKLP